MTGVSWSVDAHAPPNRGGHLLARSSDSSVCASYVYAAVPPHLFPRRASADVVRVDGSRSSGAPQPRGGPPLGSRHARTPAQAAERIRAAGAARPGPAASSRWGLGARAQRHAQISCKAWGWSLEPYAQGPGCLSLEPNGDESFDCHSLACFLGSVLPQLKKVLLYILRELLPHAGQGI